MLSARPITLLLQVSLSCAVPLRLQELVNVQPLERGAVSVTVADTLTILPRRERIEQGPELSNFRAINRLHVTCLP